MKPATAVRRLLLSIVIAASSAATPVLAQVSVNINIGPPAPLYEIAPSMAPGYIWAPGYWAWHGDRHIWVRGRTMVQRVGYRWEPDRWEQRNQVYYRNPGRWERDDDARFVKVKKEKKPKHWERDRDDDDDGPGSGRGGKRGKGPKHER